MLDPRTLRGSLTVTYAAALCIALVAFAGFALLVLDRIGRIALDQQLVTVARSLAAIAQVQRGRLALDATDRRQFPTIVGAKQAGALIDRDGTRVASTVLAIPAAVAEAKLPDGTGPGLITARGGRGDLRIAIVPVGGAGAAFAWTELDSIGDADRRAAIALAIAIPVVVGLAVGGASAVARRGLRPLERLAQLASEIEEHDLSRRLSAPATTDELGRLCATFDRMLERLEAAFERQRRFTSDASHELRAPLAIVRAEAEVALRRERTPAEYRAALRTVLHEAQELEAITEDLLATARSEAVVAPAQAQTDLGVVAARTVQRFEQLAHRRGIAVAVSRRGSGRARIREEDATRVVVAVVHNALKFAASQVDVAVESDEHGVALLVGDDGPGFSAEGKAHAFDRFWREDRARHRSGGTGLGLSIAHRIVEAHGGSIHIGEATAGGALVHVRFTFER